MPQRLVVDPPRTAEMGRVAQFPHHHPQGRAQTQTDLHRRLRRHHPEKIDPGREAQDQHQESQHDDHQLISRHEVVSPRRLEHAGNHHRETEARGGHGLEPKELHDQGVRADLKRRVRKGPVSHAQKRGDLQDRHRRVEVQPARDRPVDPVSIAAGPGVGDLPLQRRARRQTRTRTEKNQIPRRNHKPHSQPGQSPAGSSGSSTARRQPEGEPAAPARTSRSRGGPEPAAELAVPDMVAVAELAVLTESFLGKVNPFAPWR